MQKNFSNIIAVLFSLLSGTIFGLGLILAGMANPAKVLAFLDLAGLWDPSLALVMAGAIGVGLIAFALAKKRSTSFLGLKMHLPSLRIIDKRLVIGGLAFGIGWGLSGICPAPAFVLLGTGTTKAIIFVVSMLIGMEIFEKIESYRNKSQR